MEDYISKLPLDLCHNIMSRLSEKEIVRTSVLSRQWNSTFYLFPVLSLFGTKVTGDIDAHKNRFSEYVRKRLAIFWIKKSKIKEFKLKLDHYNLDYIGKEEVDSWLKFATERKVEVIELNECSGKIDRNYVFPAIILSESVMVLNLKNRIMIENVIYENPSVVFPLKVLKLFNVVLEKENTVEELISLCPSLECITLRSCWVISMVRGYRKDVRKRCLVLKGLPNLKTVFVTHMTHGIKVDAPTVDLNDLHIGNVVVRNSVGLFTTFSFLEKLCLQECEMPEKVEFSSDNLKELSIASCSKMKEMTIDAPNLVECVYYYGGKDRDPWTPAIKFKRRSKILEITIMLSEIDYDIICNLKPLFKKIKPIEVWKSLTLMIDDRKNAAAAANPFLMDNPSTSLPPRIKRLTLCFVPRETVFSPLANVLFSSCRPSYLLFLLTPNSNCQAFIEFFYEKLMEKIEKGDLKDVKVTNRMMKIKEDTPVESIIALVASSPDPEIQFRLYY